MPHGYCTECRARVTAVEGRCLLGHHLDQSTISSRRGRRISGVAHSTSRGAVSVLDRVLPDQEQPKQPISNPVTPALGSPAAPRRPAPAKPQRQPGDRIIDTGEHRRVSLPPAPTAPAREGSAGFDLNPTGEMVFQLWDQKTGSDAALFDDWQVSDAMSGMPERSGPRIASAALLLLGVAAVILALVFIFGSRGSDRAHLDASAAELADGLEAFDATTQSDFADLDQAARALLDSAQQLEVGDPGRALAIDAATHVLDGERAVSEALAYQTRFTVFVGRPALPTAADDVSPVNATYTEWSSGLLQALEPVPTLEAFEGHQAVVADFTGWAPKIQARYLDALRAGDAGAATQALSRLDTRVSEVETSLAGAVTASRQAFGSTVTAARDLLARMPTDT